VRRGGTVVGGPQQPSRARHVRRQRSGPGSAGRPEVLRPRERVRPRVRRDRLRVARCGRVRAAVVTVRVAHRGDGFFYGLLLAGGGHITRVLPRSYIMVVVAVVVVAILSRRENAN